MKTKKTALIGALALAFSATAFAQAASDTAGMAAPASGAHAKSKGTTLHQQNKAHKLKGASAAAAASSLGTNDKGQPQ
ncbi:hypothetical protein [Caballeronia concitans]|jgi:Spy/CpxP family protein refolding chaperone|uniref:DhaL domain-containing protein n=1 Tax=Caballeronia concitans TaxID=1777133 RepID=A0A658QSP8_9BURK|nr:hypothetical protein [Caballeronia concitans]KIG04261.1 hypothetical protein BurMR1_4341 [Burkholderia sp. MR1]SAL16736.1 hypothetical protein AWB72_00999 [Caballeronia concitans]